MKVLTVVCNLHKGGTQRAAQNFCEAYSKLGHDSRALGVLEGGSRQVELESLGLKVWIGLEAGTLEELTAWGPEIVHLHSHGIEYTYVSALKGACPHAVFIETNVFSAPSEWEQDLRFSYQLSEWCSFLYKARGGDYTRTATMPYAVKCDAFFKEDQSKIDNFKARYDIPANSFVFGRIGQNYFGKWSYHLIRLFEKFLASASQPCVLLLVNPPIEITKQIEASAIKDKIILIETIIGDEELRVCYSVIDVFLHIANQGESFGFVLTESLLCETPVITMNTPWGDNSQGEVVGHMVGGLCANTFGEFLSMMKRLFAEVDLRRRLGVQGRLSVLKRYDHLNCGQRVIDSCQVSHSILGVDSIKKLGVPEMQGPRPARTICIRIMLWVKLRNIRSHRLVNLLIRRILFYSYK